MAPIEPDQVYDDSIQSDPPDPSPEAATEEDEPEPEPVRPSKKKPKPKILSPVAEDEENGLEEDIDKGLDAVSEGDAEEEEEQRPPKPKKANTNSSPLKKKKPTKRVASKPPSGTTFIYSLAQSYGKLMMPHNSSCQQRR